MSRRVLLLLPTTSYKAADFLAAAERLAVDVVVGTDRRQALERTLPGHTLQVAFGGGEGCLAQVFEAHAVEPFAAVIGADDETTLSAAEIARRLGLPHNDPDAVRATRDKWLFRTRLRQAGLAGPRFSRLARDEDPAPAAERARYPSVIKPVSLSGSRGVLRVDDAAQFVEAFRRVERILQAAGDTRPLLVEDYRPGEEYAVEGLLTGGRLQALAVFEKPDPLEGPTFEETIYLTPARIESSRRDAIVDEVAAGCRALGLSEGPVHAEARWTDGSPWLLEIAPRTIGGLCARTLRFGAGLSLEGVVLRHAIGDDVIVERESCAAGVMMIPIPRAGILQEVDGLDAARAVAGVDEVTLTQHRGARLVPLPEGDRYLGFIVARRETADEVESALRQAHARIELRIA